MFFRVFKIALLCMILSIFVSCSAGSVDNSISTNTSKESYCGKEDLQIFSEEKHYKVFSLQQFKYTYQIFDKSKNIVYEETVNTFPEISMIGDEIVSWRINKGTGLVQCRYYSIKRDSVSNEFYYVATVSNEFIAYIKADDGFDNRKLVVQNIFDKEDLYKEYTLNFSQCDTPVLEASFLDEDKFLKIIYLSEESEVEKVLKVKG